MSKPIARKDIAQAVKKAFRDTPLVDIHTHLHDPSLGSILLWGIDELLTYHYLVAEVLRARPDIGFDAFWKLSKTRQADLIWTELFVKRSPISEACRGVLTVLTRLGLDPNEKNLARYRKYFAATNPRKHVDTVFGMARIKQVYMTNDPLDPAEGPQWQKKKLERDPRFLAALRLDSAVMNWPAPVARLRALGYDVEPSLSGRTLRELRRYLNEWCARMNARYLAISLPPSFSYPADFSPVTTILTKAAFPVARDRGIATALMIGVRKLANPELRLAGDAVGKADIETVERIAHDFGDVRFLITMLSRENMHELCIAARKFKNIKPFGCWWFLNNPSLIREITQMRFETLGLSFVPQHSDARVLDQLIYKWEHSRKIIGTVLAERYADMVKTTRDLRVEDIRRDIGMMFGGVG